MKTTFLLFSGVLCATLSLTTAAEALPESIHRIPHGAVFGCQTCHPGGDEKALNPMGKLTQGIRHARVAPEDWWTIMYSTDSDGDGLTNGEELGDPCGEWVLDGPAPNVQFVSNPGDDRSWIELDQAPDCPPLPIATDATVSLAPFMPQDAPQGACALAPGEGSRRAGGVPAGALVGLAAALAIGGRRRWSRPASA